MLFDIYNIFTFWHTQDLNILQHIFCIDNIWKYCYVWSALLCHDTRGKKKYTKNSKLSGQNISIDCRGTCSTSVPTHWNTLQHTATHCNTLQHTATHCTTLQHTATHCNTLQHIATHCHALQHTATHCNTLHVLHFLCCSMLQCVVVCCSALQI